jgi:hypothetical protein
VENIRNEKKSSPKRKSDKLVNSKTSISNKSPKEILSNAGCCQSAKRHSPKNGDQISWSKKKEVTTSAKEKKNSRRSKTVIFGLICSQ